MPQPSYLESKEMQRSVVHGHTVVASTGSVGSTDIIDLEIDTSGNIATISGAGIPGFREVSGSNLL
jgi:hypothetical protein